MPDEHVSITVGVDTYADTHTAVALDEVGRRLDSIEFDAAETGHRRLLERARDLGEVTVVGIEGTGSYGAGLARFLSGEGVEVIEVGRPNRQHRHRAWLLDKASRDVAAKLLIAAGDNPERLGTEAGFAALCGVNPIKASSGKTNRHRLNRSGRRRANNALWTIARVRLSHDPETHADAQRREQEGLSRRVLVRCRKRYLGRRLYPILLTDLAELT